MGRQFVRTGECANLHTSSERCQLLETPSDLVVGVRSGASKSVRWCCSAHCTMITILLLLFFLGTISALVLWPDAERTPWLGHLISQRQIELQIPTFHVGPSIHRVPLPRVSLPHPS